MYELLVFPTEIEHQGTRELIQHNFPVAVLHDIASDADIMMDMTLPVPPAKFLKWTSEMRNGIHVLSYCYNMTLALLDIPMPRWLVLALREQPDLLDSLSR